MLDFISIFLGLLAWGIPLYEMSPKRDNTGYIYVLLSFGACAISMQLQIFQILKALSEQVTGMGERVDAVTLSSGILMVGTFFLVGLSVYLRKKRSKK